MRRAAPLLWLVLVLAAAAHLALRAAGGITFQTDLMALLPQEERDPAVQAAKERVAAEFGRRIFLLVGHGDRAAARAVASDLAERLSASGLVESVMLEVDADTQRRLAQAFFPYREGLLSAGDRARLQQGQGDEIVKRALSSVYGMIGVADARLLRFDPFLLLPAYFSELPLPLARLTPDGGLLSVEDGGRTYVFLTAKLQGSVFSLDFQERLARFFTSAEEELRSRAPGLEILRTGSVFFAHEAAQGSLRESSAIGAASLLGTTLLILLVFRAARPLWFSALAIAVGILFAYSAALAIFGEIHVGALLFGVSLIGVAVDYSLVYSAQRFDPSAATPYARLRRVMPGISLGLATTVIGYLTLLLAPFPGLHQVAVFSVLGLAASFATVVLWAPALDRTSVLAPPRRLLAAAEALWSFWQRSRFRAARLTAGAVLGTVVVAGLAATVIDDDVRRLQPLSPELKRQEQELRRLTGVAAGGQFLLVQGRDTEAALQTEEALAPLLDAARAGGALAGYQSVAQFVPSATRQAENRVLVRERLLQPYLAAYYGQLGMTEVEPTSSAETRALLLADLFGEKSLWFLSNLVIDGSAGPTTHIVLLQGVTDAATLRPVVEAVPGVLLVDPTGDVSRLLGEYRTRAVFLLAASLLLMIPLMAWRYGALGSLRVALPSLAAVVVAPAMTALLGLPFTFFNAMALVMVLSIGIDYAIFCRETAADRAVTVLGVALAMMTTMLSFGLLAMSGVAAIRAFGLTMLFGILTAFLLAPSAALGRSEPGRRNN